MIACVDAIISKGMKVQVNLMYGFPWDNRESAEKQLAFVRSLQKPGIGCFSAGSTVFPYPGTELFESSKEKGFPIHNWWLRDDFLAKNNAVTLYEKNKVRPRYRSIVLSPPRIDMTQDFFDVYRDPEVKQLVESALREMHEWNQRQNGGRFLRFRFVRMIIPVIGSVLFFLSPKIEKKFWQILLKTV